MTGETQKEAPPCALFTIEDRLWLKRAGSLKWGDKVLVGKEEWNVSNSGFAGGFIIPECLLGQNAPPGGHTCYSHTEGSGFTGADVERVAFQRYVKNEKEEEVQYNELLHTKDQIYKIRLCYLQERVAPLWSLFMLVGFLVPNNIRMCSFVTLVKPYNAQVGTV